MKRFSSICLFAALLLSACAPKKPARVATPAPAPAPATTPRTAKPQPRTLPAPAPVPAPATQPESREPLSLQSRTDSAADRAVIEARIRDTRSSLDQLAYRNNAQAVREDRDRASAMLDLAQQALTRGDLRQASDLSTRAATLAKALNAK